MSKCEQCNRTINLAQSNVCLYCLRIQSNRSADSGIPCPVCHRNFFNGDVIDITNVDKINDYDNLKAKADLFGDLVDCIDNLVKYTANIPSVLDLLEEAKGLK